VCAEASLMAFRTRHGLPLSRCHGLYYSAMRADLVYDRAIKKLAGRNKTRWTLTKSESAIPAIRRAFKRKVAIDKARARACDVMRRTGR
jgi:hypothetical protein